MPGAHGNAGEQGAALIRVDTETGEHWVTANGMADKLSDPAKHMQDWDGPTRRSALMRHFVRKMYEVVD